MAQGAGIDLVNGDRDFVERKKEGEFVARPVFDRKIKDLYYAVRDADTGEWVSAMYRVRGGEKRRSDGWEYSWGYPALEEQPELDPDRAYLLAMLVTDDGGGSAAFHAVIAVYEPSKHLGQDSRSPQPRTMGQGLRRLGDRGSPRKRSTARWSGRPARTPPTAGEGSLS